MKSKTKAIILILIIFFNLSTVFMGIIYFKSENINIRFNDICDFNIDNKNLKNSKISGIIHIIGNSGWVDFRNDGNCTGSGTYSDPYVIEDLIINGNGTESCIVIENSNVFFKIEDCTVLNSKGWSDAGIQISNVNNSHLINNNCSSNFFGIALSYSNNITISGNHLNRNYCGIYLSDSNNTKISGNIMKNCGLILSSSSPEVGVHNIDVTNLVNHRPLYYYNKEFNLKSNDFMDAGQVLLINCDNSIISNLEIFNTSIGISLQYCHNVTVTQNNLIDNKISGIDLLYSHDNNISRNNVIRNNVGIAFEESNNNLIMGNEINKNNYSGIHFTHHNTYNTISGNKIYSNGMGLYFDNSNYNNISRNIVNLNEIAGIFLSISYYSTIWQNTLNNNSGTGIFLNAGRYSFISENIAKYNNLSGIYIMGNENNISGNVFNNNAQHGIDIWGSDDLTLVDNTVNLNGENGIKIDFSYNNMLLRNTANFNSKNGIEIISNHDNVLSRNTVNFNSENGIELSDCMYNELLGNIINENSLAGIKLIESDQNLIVGNTLIGNNICISEIDCIGNYFENNICRDSYPVNLVIPGYASLFLLSIISIVSIFFIKRIKKSSNLNS
ncbi:MAG: NosD domain-containing protein [Promethearchaeota archaeon]